MGQNQKFLGSGILIHTLELKLRPFEISSCLYREAMCLQCFPPTRYVKNGEYPWCALFRKFLKIGVQVVCLLCKALHCILGVLCGFLDNFFLLSVLVMGKLQRAVTLILKCESKFRFLETSSFDPFCMLISIICHECMFSQSLKHFITLLYIKVPLNCVGVRWGI